VLVKEQLMDKLLVSMLLDSTIGLGQASHLVPVVGLVLKKSKA